MESDEGSQSPVFCPRAGDQSVCNAASVLLVVQDTGTPSPLSTVFTKTGGGGSTTNANINPTADLLQFPSSAMVDTFYELSAGGVLMDLWYHALGIVHCILWIRK